MAGAGNRLSYALVASCFEMQCAAYKLVLSQLFGSRKRRFVAGGLFSLVALTVGSLALMLYDIQASHQDYDQIESCLKKHGLAVKDGWKYTDMGLEIIGLPALENFGFTFATSNNQLWSLEIIDGYGVRDCDDPVAWVWLSGVEIALPEGRALSLNHPELLQALDGKEIKTLDDLMAQLEWLLVWASEHPDAFLADDEEIPAGGGLVHFFGLPL
ncbi:MAG: hypothetical protein AB8B99_13250 [Phormidesmis sp.]